MLLAMRSPSCSTGSGPGLTAGTPYSDSAAARNSRYIHVHVLYIHIHIHMYMYNISVYIHVHMHVYNIIIQCTCTCISAVARTSLATIIVLGTSEIRCVILLYMYHLIWAMILRARPLLASALDTCTCRSLGSLCLLRMM